MGDVRGCRPVNIDRPEDGDDKKMDADVFDSRYFGYCVLFHFFG